MKLEGHQGLVTGVTFNADGSRLATSSTDQTAKIWDTQTGRLLFTLAGHEAAIPDIAFSPDGTLLATGSGDNTAILWNLATGKELHSFFGSAGGVMGVSFHPDGSKLALSSGDGVIRVYTLKTIDLLTLAQSRVTRSLSLAECQKYLHTSSCPAGQEK